MANGQSSVVISVTCRAELDLGIAALSCRSVWGLPVAEAFGGFQLQKRLGASSCRSVWGLPDAGAFGGFQLQE
eukprot:1726939-Pleurochrysis_carterae.AAC.1